MERFIGFPIRFREIVEADPEWWRNYLTSFPWLVACVSDECFEFLLERYEQEIRAGLAVNWKHLMFFSKERFVQRATTFQDELKPHFLKRPGLWFYMFRYDQKKINPRTGEVDKDLDAAWSVMDSWGMLHPSSKKIGKEWKICDD